MRTPSLSFGRYSQTTLERRQSLPFWPQVDQALQQPQPAELPKGVFLKSFIGDLQDAVTRNDRVTLSALETTLASKEAAGIFTPLPYLARLETTMREQSFPEIPEVTAQAVEGAFRRAADRGDLSQ